MRMQNVAMLYIAVVISAAFGPAVAQVKAGVSIDEGGANGFYLAIGAYYGVPEKEVVVIKERKIPDEELPVVFFIAKRAKVKPEAIVELRLSGRSWVEICTHYHLSQDIFFVPVAVEVSSPPYARVYAYHKNKGKKDVKAIVYTDDEVVNFVNLKFISEHQGYPPEEIIRMRGEGKGFIVVNDEVGKAKHGKKKGKG